MCKRKCGPAGSQRRFVVTNLSGDPRGIDRSFDGARGEVPEQPFDELKNGLDVGRLSAHRLRANADRLVLHMVAYGLVVRFGAAASTEVRRASVGTWRQRWWKVGALGGAGAASGRGVRRAAGGGVPRQGSGGHGGAAKRPARV